MRGGKTGYKRKEAGDPERPPCQEGEKLWISPASRGHGTFFNLPLRKSPNPRPERTVAFFTVSAPEQASIAASGNQRPASLGIFGSAAGSCSEPRQVAVKSNPEGDPALGRVRSDDRLPVTCFPGAQTELGSKYILITLGENTRGRRELLKNIFGGLSLGTPALSARGDGLFFIDAFDL